MKNPEYNTPMGIYKEGQVRRGHVIDHAIGQISLVDLRDVSEERDCLWCVVLCVVRCAGYGHS